MQIIHKIDDFLFTLFPELMGGGNELIISVLKKYYTYGVFSPKVRIEEDWAIIDIDTQTIFDQEADYQKSVALCERGKYSEAKPILINLLNQNPTNSEYYRILGQIFSDEGDQDEAINFLIDALKWDSKNSWALLMMGNIFAKFKNDVPTAMKYYDQVLISSPNDSLTLNNIGANLLSQGKIEEAKKYFLNAVKINDQYPNTFFALGMISEMEKDFHSAFSSTIRAIKLNKKRDDLYQNSIRQAIEIAKKIIAKGEARQILNDYKKKLISEGGTQIDIFEDTEIPTAAKFEFAENYIRPNHTVRFKPNYPASEHLVMHELVHLDFVIRARQEGINQLFLTNDSHKSLFIKELEPTVKKLLKMGISEESISTYCIDLFSGLNSQIYNTPIDLFIEDFLYSEFADLRPYQFLSLYNMNQEGKAAVTDKKIVQLSPKDILSKSKIYNLVNAIQFRELFGIEIISEFYASQAELTQANEFYNEYLQYKEDKEPAEEYELVINWAEDLKLNKYFDLEGEIQFRNRRNPEIFFNSLESDPYGIGARDPIKEREMQQFQKSQQEIGINMAVAMFMVDALKYFKKLPTEEIRKIAFEIALQGTQGYSPDRQDYVINAIPKKVFSGYHILAFYYVSFALSIPEMLDKLQLPYDEEYKLAIKLNNPIDHERY